MLKFLLFVLLSLASQVSFAAEQACTKLAAKVDSLDEYYLPPIEGKVIGNKRLYFYTAPDLQCKMKGIFMIKNDSLTVYSTYKNWLRVMYIGKNGEDYVGWVSAKMVRIM